MNKQSSDVIALSMFESQKKEGSFCRSSNLDKPSVQWVTISDVEGQRLDNYLCRTLKGVPKTRIYRIIRKGEVRVNKKRVAPGYRLQDGDFLRIPPVRVAEETEKTYMPVSVSELLAKSLLYEDAGLLIINKPSGLAVHGGSGISCGIIEAFRQMRPKEKGLELVHRLDRETSGCLMIAKKRSVLRHIHGQLQNNEVKKVYHTLVVGCWPLKRHIVNAPLRKNTLCSGERIVRVDVNGKASKTCYRVLERFSGVTLVEASPLTGRTHQIRVHCLEAGHAIIGDAKYGNDKDNQRYRQQGVKRLFLHAASLTLTLPTGVVVTVEAPLPNDLGGFLQKMGAEKMNDAPKVT
ncbi:MAG: 23S rRNA pseudouridine(955/2504/2580) synthase RluC [Candidatus Endonucleobacter bathymodioli]|uniref:Pseudouridine synthase n=1 Tax=Candidatus Endonucleibacter bathymodioli TaxID=539814 RepID=A0AA90SLL0_9GAMM|nr:23S rRNA pseudouridine(955/2504/2580) synthase RluC [Candidatus Endonucleobacter bathymodioli]